MKILNFKTILGPNVYHYKPVIIMHIDLEEWSDVASMDAPGFNDRLKNLLPGLAEHSCSLGRKGGFFERLDRGTYFAHIIEHVAIELSVLCGIEVNYGKAAYAHIPGHYNIIVRFKNQEGMKACLRWAVELVRSQLHGEEFDLHRALAEIQLAIENSAFGPSTQTILDAAKRRKIPVRHIAESLIELGYGKNLKRFQAAVTSNTNLVASDIAQCKDLTKAILARNLIPVCHGVAVDSDADNLSIEAALKDLKFPLAVKPVDGNHGKGVSLNLSTTEEVLLAAQRAKTYSKKILIEEMAQGRDYRLLLINFKLVAVAERRPACIEGNGFSSIAELIEKVNQDPLRKEGHAGFLTKIIVTEDVTECLRKQGLSLEFVPQQGRTIYVRENANLSTGGTAIDVTGLVNPAIKNMAERAARLIGLDICGVDLIHDDITNAPNSSTKIIEVNAGPGLRMHIQPTEGEGQNIGDMILDMLYPPQQQSRIPIVSITGTNGKTTVTRLIEKICGQKGARVGMTTTDGIWIAGRQVAAGDMTGPKSCGIVLSDPAVDMAVLEVARGGLVRNGLGYDWSDGAVLTNIRPEHFGQDGIESIEDLQWIKSLPLERVKEGGFIVVNADDPASMEVAFSSRVQSLPRQLILFSTDKDNLHLRRHRAKGGTCYWQEGRHLFCQYQERTRQIASLEEIPFTINGTVRFQVENIMASLAAGVAMGFDLQESLQVLRSFKSNESNLGRMNIYQVRDTCVILDYAHNPDAIESVGKMLKHYEGFQTTAIFGLPGDRSDELLAGSCHQVARYFDHVMIREDFDLRGRSPGEMTAIIERELAKHPQTGTWDKIPNGLEALEKTLLDSRHKGILVVFYEELEPVLKVLRQFDPVAIEKIPFPLKDNLSREAANPIYREVLNVNPV